MHEHAPRMRGADRVGSLNVFAHLVLQVFGADQPEDPGPARETQDQDHGKRPLLVQHRGDRENQQQVGYRGEDAVEPIEEIVDPAAVIAGERAEDGGEKRGEKRGDQPHEHRGLRSLDRFLQDVAAPSVSAEDERGRLGFGDRRGPGCGPDLGEHPGQRIERVSLARPLAAARSRHRRTAIGDLRPHEGRRRIVDADFLRPIGCDQVHARRRHETEEEHHDQERGEPHAVAAEAPPGEGP